MNMKNILLRITDSHWNHWLHQPYQYNDYEYFSSQKGIGNFAGNRFLGMSKADIAKAEGTHKSRITRSIEAGLRSLEKYFKEIL